MRRALVVLLIAAGVYMSIWGGGFDAFRASEIQDTLRARESELPVLLERIDSIERRMEALRTDDEALERLARERYGFVREGERLYRIAPRTAPDTGRVPGQSPR